MLILCGFKSLLINWSTGIVLPKKQNTSKKCNRYLEGFINFIFTSHEIFCEMLQTQTRSSPDTH